MEKNRLEASVRYQGVIYSYRVDSSGTLWITDTHGTEISIDQNRGIKTEEDAYLACYHFLSKSGMF